MVVIRIDLPAFNHNYCSLIGYTTHLVVNKMAAAPLHFHSVCERDLDKVLNHW